MLQGCGGGSPYYLLNVGTNFKQRLVKFSCPDYGFSKDKKLRQVDFILTSDMTLGD